MLPMLGLCAVLPDQLSSAPKPGEPKRNRSHLRLAESPSRYAKEQNAAHALYVRCSPRPAFFSSQSW